MMTRHVLLTVGLLAVCLVLAAGGIWAETGDKPNPLRVLVVTGGHDYETAFYTVFEGYDDLVWSHAVSNQSAFRSDIRGKYDVLVLYDMSQELSEEGRRNLQDFVESGKGVVSLHHAIANYQKWPWWYREVVGGRYVLEAEEGYPASSYKHDVDLVVEPVGNHPITAGMGAMEIRDETYKGMWISPHVQVILRTDNPSSDGPLGWISPYEKSRVVYIQLGHDSHAYRHPGYRALVRNAILWSAGRLK
jgi:type 1 glutamine amidotransferase